jgi:hypothetical protein
MIGCAMKQDELVTTHEETPLGYPAAIEPQRVTLPHSVIVRAPGLLPMLYRPSELAEELTVSAAVVRDWVEKGLPHHRDHRGHMWIDGRQAAEWVKVTRQRPAGSRMAEGQAYCFRCCRAVELRDPVAQYHGKQVLLSGICPQCGGNINRGGRND